MFIPLPNLLLIVYPGITIGLGLSVELQDHGNGMGAEISSWSYENSPQPTKEEIDAWQNDVNNQAAYQAVLNTDLNAGLLSQLDIIDLKSIRAIRENNTQLIAQWTTQAAALRAKLLPMTIAGVLAVQGNT